MEVNFDKQIDTILRDLVEQNALVETLPKSHIDADQLSAFVENVLPAAARRRTIEHLADCANCRIILANFISLDNDAQSEIIHENSGTIAAIPRVPWYRRLFVFPQLAYTMGAVVLVFSGMVGYIVFQSSEYSRSTIARQTEDNFEKPIGGNGSNNGGDGRFAETNSSYSENTTISSSANTASNRVDPGGSPANKSAPMSPADSDDKVAKTEATPYSAPVVAVPSDEGPEVVGKTFKKSDADLKTNKDRVVSSEETLGKKGAGAPVSEVVNETKVQDVAENNVSRQQVVDAPVQGRNQSNVIMPDGANQSQRNLPAPVSRKSEVRRDQDESDAGASGERERSQKKMSEKPTTTIGEKTFRSVNGVWTDSVYKGGKTITIKRGTEDYKKQDSDLQRIGNALRGTVIVVWNGRSYKIQ